MGIKNLWTVLAPFCDRKPLYELQGKTVAVDLSCWICEAQNIAEYQVQPRMYLRNLYFRTCYLLLMEVNPVFVLEGKAPELKYDTISARNAVQFKGAKPKNDNVKTGKGRTRFNFVLKQCEQMLGFMGLACIVGKGEAENLCACLNEDGLVEGCISQDSDCFAYGALVVYRNFSISTQGAYAASGGAVDIYDIRKAQTNINFGRNKIIAMALLIGCDYNDGIHGVGKDSVMKFFENLNDEEVLNRIRSWRQNESLYQKYEHQVNDKNVCSSCGHTGKIQNHSKNGCILCKTTRGCDSEYKNERVIIKNELNIRNKAVQDPNFPDENLIKEFLVKKDNVKKLDLKWKQPDAVNFVKFASKFLQWEEYYSFKKILPILTRWQCLNPSLVKTQTNLKGILKPDKIKKVRNPKGIPSYEIVWRDTNGCFDGLIPEHQLTELNIDSEKLWSTVEPQNLVDVAYPELVETYKQSKIKPKKPSKRKKKDMEELPDSEPKPKKERKPRQPKISMKNIVKSDNLIKNTECDLDALDSSFKQISIDNNEKKINFEIKKKFKTLDSFVRVKNAISKENMKVSTPSKVGDVSFDVNMSRFGDEDDLDVSSIVDDIVSQDIAKEWVAKYVEGNLDNKEPQNVLKEKTILVQENAYYGVQDCNSSSFFFTNNFDNEDLFEKTFNQNLGDDSDSGSDTEEYDVNDIVGNEDSNSNTPNEEESNDKNEGEECGVNSENVAKSSDEDSFCIEYVPLFERIKNKQMKH